jgi:isoquinoline 1-oxidoreductase subunit alpha
MDEICESNAQPHSIRPAPKHSARFLVQRTAIVWRRSITAEEAELHMELTVNGARMNVGASDDTPLLWALRDHLGLTGTKFGCGMSLCGACTVHIDGQPMRACVTPLSAVAGKKIVTIEGVGATPQGRALQEAWMGLNVPQCGYCQSGQIMSAAALLVGNPKPSDADIDSAMTGNICRCGTYPRIRAAIKQAAGRLEQKA